MADAEACVLNDIPFELDAEALMRTAHVRPGGDDARHFATLIETARRAGQPKAMYRDCAVDAGASADVTVGGVVFTSAALHRNLDGVDRVFAYVATCGAEMDAMAGSALPEGDMLAEFWWDTIKASLLWAANLHLRDHLCRLYGLEKTATMNPGSGDAHVWPIQQQKLLFGLLGDVEACIGVRLTDSCLMMPNKTVSGLLFASETGWRSCQVCHREGCPGRSAPFDPDLYEAVQHG